jgi:hypothetical protein
MATGIYLDNEEMLGICATARLSVMIHMSLSSAE